MKFHPKVSIVIPVYNGSNYLREAIDSALAQTYDNIEILVINDGSNDNGATEKIAESYGNKIHYYAKENGGVATALNLGIEKMTGEYFSWLSHDDLYYPDKIEKQVKYLEKLNRKDVIIASNVRVLFSSGVKKKEKIDSATFKFIDIFLATSAIVGVNGCSLLIPKKAFETCGGFDVCLPVTQDYDLWFRLKDRYDFYLLDKFLVVSRRHPNQDSVQKNELMREAGDKLHYDFLQTVPYSRFEEYFKHNNKNVKHAYINYKAYKSKGYISTALLMFKNISRYYYENDREMFYTFFQSEIESNAKSNKKLSGDDRERIIIDYKKFIKSDLNNPLVKESPSTNTTPHSSTSMTRLRGSVKEDGIYLTGEKIVRKIHKKITNKN